jgi:hypothetical protein
MNANPFLNFTSFLGERKLARRKERENNTNRRINRKINRLKSYQKSQSAKLPEEVGSHGHGVVGVGVERPGAVEHPVEHQLHHPVVDRQICQVILWREDLLWKKSLQIFEEEERLLKCFVIFFLLT